MPPLTLINGVENYIQAYAATSKDKTLEKYTSVLRENILHVCLLDSFAGVVNFKDEEVLLLM